MAALAVNLSLILYIVREDESFCLPTLYSHGAVCVVNLVVNLVRDAMTVT